MTAASPGVDRPDDGLLDGLRVLAESAAREAGDLLLGGWHGRLTVTAKSTPTDVVTQMDRASEHLLVDRLLAARPGDAVLGEEGGGRPGTSGVRWVLDPLDGTVNYLYGLPVWAVSVAAQVDGRTAVGVVHCPAARETFVAVLGGGAHLDGPDGRRRLSVSGVARLPEALVATGFGYDSARRAAQARVVAALLPAARDIRRAGAAAVDLCSVAAGRVDAYYERGCHLWDFAAGALVAAEAGARVEGLRGAPPGEDLVVAAGPGVFGALHALLEAQRADEG